MYFLVNGTKKIIFGWSAKCGCSHIKYLWNELNNGKPLPASELHNNSYNQLPLDFHKYTILIFIRNPYLKFSAKLPRPILICVLSAVFNSVLSTA